MLPNRFDPIRTKPVLIASLPMDAPTRLTREGELWDLWRRPAIAAALTPVARDTIRLYGVVQIADAEYLAVSNPPAAHTKA